MTSTLRCTYFEKSKMAKYQNSSAVGTNTVGCTLSCSWSIHDEVANNTFVWNSDSVWWCSIINTCSIVPNKCPSPFLVFLSLQKRSKQLLKRPEKVDALVGAEFSSLQHWNLQNLVLGKCSFTSCGPLRNETADSGKMVYKVCTFQVSCKQHLCSRDCYDKSSGFLLL